MRTALIMTLCLIVALTAFACGPAEEPTSGEGEMAEEHSSEEHETAETESSGNEHEDHGSMTMSSSGSMGGERIHVSMTDQGEMYTMVPEAHSVHAGPVTFVAENEGLIEHELIVVKLLDMNVDLTALHVVDTQLVEVESGGVTYIADAAGRHIGQVIAATGHDAHLTAGHTVELNADLTAGHYLLVCNIETHYQLGMWTEFEAT